MGGAEACSLPVPFLAGTVCRCQVRRPLVSLLILLAPVFLISHHPSVVVVAVVVVVVPPYPQLRVSSAAANVMPEPSRKRSGHAQLTGRLTPTGAANTSQFDDLFC